MTGEDIQEFLKEAWTDDSFAGYCKRYMMLSNIVQQALKNKKKMAHKTRKRVGRQILILWGKTKGNRSSPSYPKLHARVIKLSEEFNEYDVACGTSKTNA